MNTYVRLHTMDNSNYDIFLSYRREDGAEFCEGLANELINQGFSVFFDKKSLRGGCDFPNDIRDAVNGCSEFILIASKSYFGLNRNNEIRIMNDDDWCAEELHIALNNEKTNLFPILIDCQTPSKNSLPERLAGILNLNFINYDRSIDTYDKIVDKIKKNFHNSTVEKALVGHIIKKIDNVPPNDIESFNVACKEVMKLIADNKDEDALLHILKAKDDNGYVYNNDKRFIVFYILFSYYRRIRQIIKMITLIENNGDFSTYLFYNYVLTEYNVSKYSLSENDEDEKKYLLNALKYSKLAVESLRNNRGIIHSFCLIIALLLENNLTVGNDEVELAFDYINMIIADDKYYAKYYATKARLLAQMKKYDDALKNIRYAETLESADNKDWIMRVSEYYKIEMLIMLMMNSVKNK